MVICIYAAITYSTDIIDPISWILTGLHTAILTLSQHKLIHVIKPAVNRY